MIASSYPAFLLASFLFSLSPGAGAISSMSTSISNGLRGAILSILGLQLALIIHLSLVAFGLGGLIASSATAFETLKYLGAAYLVYLGVQKWRADPADGLPGRADAAPGRPVRLFFSGLGVNLTNPKSIVFLAAFLPQFLDPGRPQAEQFALLGLTIVIVDIAVMLMYACLASSIRRLISTPAKMRLQNRLFGSLFIGVGAALAAAAPRQ